MGFLPEKDQPTGNDLVGHKRPRKRAAQLGDTVDGRQYQTMDVVAQVCPRALHLLPVWTYGPVLILKALLEGSSKSM